MSHDDIRDRAIELLRLHGDAAGLHAALKADAAIRRLDHDGERLWTSIVREIARIEMIGPEGMVQ